MSIICKTCGHIINEDEENFIVVNSGLDSEFVICDSCACKDHAKYHVCEACGRWFTGDVIHDEVLSKRVTFTPCPSCGKDIVDCMSREEMMEEAAPYRFSVIVSYTNGYNRGYMIEAEDRKEVLEKLIDHISPLGVVNITISEILSDDDILKPKAKPYVKKSDIIKVLDDLGVATVEQLLIYLPRNTERANLMENLMVLVARKRLDTWVNDEGEIVYKRRVNYGSEITNLYPL